MTTIKLNTTGTNVKIIAHRGLSGLETENTCAAFVAAGNRDSIFGIETDIHRTLDGKFIVIHDDNTKRVAQDAMVIEESNFETLRHLRLFDKDGTRNRHDLILPSLEEYIGICARYEKKAVLELKNEFTAADIHRVMVIIDKLGYLENTIVISFCLKNLIRLRRRYPQIPAQYLLKVWDDKQLDNLVKYDLGLDIKHTAITPELCRMVHDAGKVVNCWTVNTVEDAQRVMDCGVDFITTNILEASDH